MLFFWWIVKQANFPPTKSSRPALNRPHAIKHVLSLIWHVFSSRALWQNKTHVPELNIQLFILPNEKCQLTDLPTPAPSPHESANSPRCLQRGSRHRVEKSPLVFFLFHFSNCIYHCLLSVVFEFFPPTQAKSETWDWRLRGLTAFLMFYKRWE